MSVNQVVVASTAADADAAEAIRNHHTELAGAVRVLTDALLSAADRGTDVEAARFAAVAFLTGELLPHAAAEEQHLYPAAARIEQARPLVESMIAAHRLLGDLVERVRTEPSPVRAAGAAQALRVLFEAHLADENDRILPILAADPAVSLAEITQGMHELLGSREPAPAGHRCTCGDADADEPVLDVRDIPHAIRHATVFGAFDAVPVGGTLVLVAPHDPLPLLRQLNELTTGAVEVDYVERGPQTWRLRLTRR